MTVQTEGYTFTLEESSSGHIISGCLLGGAKIKHVLPGAGFDNVERLSALESHGCGSESIDLVLQRGPTANSDLKARDYYRIIFSPDLGTVVTAFYDPSVSAANAILPLQTIEGMVDPGTGKKIICRDSTPVVVKNDELNKSKS